MLAGNVQQVVQPLCRLTYPLAQEDRPKPPGNRNELEVGDWSRLNETLTRHMIVARGRSRTSWSRDWFWGGVG